MRTNRLTALILAVITSLGCVHNHAEKESDHAEEATGSMSNAIVFTEEQSKQIDFATENSRTEPFGQVIKTTAQILPSQGDERVISAKTTGIVVFSADDMVEGRAVSAGQTLFAVESGGMADNNLQVRYTQAMTEYNRAKAEYERKSELAKERIVSEGDLLKAKTEFESAEAVYENLRKNFSGGKYVVSSPFAGFVTQVFVRGGEYVEAGSPVMVVSQNRDLLIRADVRPKYFPLLGKIVSANIRVLNSGATYTLEELGGKLVSFGRSAGAGNPLIPVLFRVKNSVGLLPGSFVEIYIKTQTSAEAITVPNEAVIEEMGSYFVFVQLAPELFEKRAVVIGATDGFRTEITDGLSAGERIVSKGAVSVKLAQTSESPQAHEHNH